MGLLKRTIPFIDEFNLKPTKKKTVYLTYKDKKKTYCLLRISKKEKYWYKFNLRMSIQIITLEISRKRPTYSITNFKTL
jgi:hypothetical protein